MAPRTRRSIGVRAILAGGLLAIIAAAVVPASAAAPNLLATTADSGWNGATLGDHNFEGDTGYTPTQAAALRARVGNDMIAATFANSLEPSASSIEVKDMSGAVVPGLSIARNVGIIWVADAKLDEDGSTYTATIKATAFGPSGTAMSDEVRSFLVDRTRPKPPVISSMSAQISAPATLRNAANETEILAGFDVNVSLTGSAPIAGTALDNTNFPNGELVATSGIQRVELRFYDLFGDLAQTINVNNTCADGQCPASFEWENDLSELEPGIWTLKAVSVDLAGLTSGPTRPLTFIHA